MGTNFYLHHIPTKEQIHIGKASGGWEFTFKRNEEYYECTLDCILEFLELAINSKDYYLIDEYGRKYYADEFKEIVIEHQGGWNFMTYHKAHPSQFQIEGIDFIAEDGTWWCNAEFC